MSYRNLSTGFSGKVNKSPIKLSYSRHKPSGLDKNTLIEGSAIDVCSDLKLGGARKTKSIPESPKQDNWREKYAALQKTVQNLRNELKNKSKLVVDLQSELKSQKECNEKELFKLKSFLENTQKESDLLKEDFKSKSKQFCSERVTMEETIAFITNQLESIKSVHAETLSTIALQHNKELVLLKGHLEAEKIRLEHEHSKALRERDSNIKSLKEKLAESFNESSKERQVQIDELLKELTRVSNEAEYVKGALRNLKSTNTDCQKCLFYEGKCKEISKELLERNETCKSLFTVCSKMEKQLNEQDDLMLIWRKVKNSQ